MNILYNPTDGEIFYAVKDSDKLTFSHSTNIALSVIEIDEIEENKDLAIDALKNAGRLDINGLGKYYISGGELYQREGWQEWIPL